jgi:hypothetical protein
MWCNSIFDGLTHPLGDAAPLAAVFFESRLHEAILEMSSPSPAASDEELLNRRDPFARRDRSTFDRFPQELLVNPNRAMHSRTEEPSSIAFCI